MQKNCMLFCKERKDDTECMGVGAPSAHDVTNDDWNYTMLYMYTNMEEVQPYFKLFDKTYWKCTSMGQMWSKLPKVVPLTCNFLLHPFSFLILVHLSHTSNWNSSIVPLYVVYA
jgi:hypothetical protein